MTTSVARTSRTAGAGSRQPSSPASSSTGPPRSCESSQGATGQAGTTAPLLTSRHSEGKSVGHLATPPPYSYYTPRMPANTNSCSTYDQSSSLTRLQRRVCIGPAALERLSINQYVQVRFFSVSRQHSPMHSPSILSGGTTAITGTGTGTGR